jgi:aryl-alcohol dehydrogenase-like predicted oxidoreductase
MLLIYNWEMLLIPGTSSVAHVEANVAAAGVSLTGTDFRAQSEAV